MVKTISSKQFIGRLLSDLRLEGTDFINNIYQWIEDGIEIMEIPKYYTYKHTRKEVNSGRVSLPCDIMYLMDVLSSNNCRVDENYQIKEYIFGLGRIVIRNSHLLGAGVDIPVIHNQFATLNGNFLNMTFDRGSVLFIYKGLPCDAEGYPMVPKNAKVNEALRYWIIYNLGLMGYEHPVIKWNDAYTMWTRTYPAASNVVNWPTLQEYQEFTEMWNNRLLGDTSDTLEFL